MTAAVDNIVALDAGNSPPLTTEQELDEIGWDKPAFSFTAKRQHHWICNSKLPWLSGCSLWKSFFCIPWFHA